MSYARGGPNKGVAVGQMITSVGFGGVGCGCLIAIMGVMLMMFVFCLGLPLLLGL